MTAAPAVPQSAPVVAPVAPVDAPHDAPRAALPVAVALVTALYLATSARAVLGGDNGEFATLFHEGGVAHPSGYPAYTLWLRALSWLPAASPAHGAALATALLGGLAAGALCLASRAWGASRHGALFALASWALASLPWRLATHAEVFALNALVALTVAWLAAPGAPVRGAARATLLGLVAGVGLGNHLSVVLVAPLGLWGVAAGLRESPRPARAAIAAVAALAPGLCTYAYLVLTARSPGERLVWGDPSTLAGLLDHVLRRDFGTFSLSASRAEADAASHVGWFVRRTFVDLHVLPAALALAGYASAPGEGDAARRARAALGASVALAGVVFLARFNIPPRGLGAVVVERFHLLPESLLAVTIARGFDLVARTAPLGAAAQRGLAAAVVVAGLARSYPDVRDEQRDTVERYLLDVLDQAPPRAVLLGTGDHRTLGFPYAQRALGRRRDVLHIDPRLLMLGPYRARVERALGRTFPFPRTRTVPTVQVAEAALATGRPVFLTDVFTPAIPRALTVYPDGLLLRVLPRGAPAPSPPSLVVALEARYRVHRQRPTRARHAPWQAEALAAYAQPWETLARAAAAAGRPDIAATLHDRAEAYTPRETP